MAAVLVWTLLAMVALDLLLGLVAHPPRNPHRRGNEIQNYLDYGTSIETKLRREIGPKAGDEAPIMTAGWLPRECDGRATRPDPRGVSIYGMSFSNHIGDILPKLDPTLHVAEFGGPAAPLNHSYACFLRREAAGIDGNAVQVLGILGSSLRRMETQSGMTTSFESVQPFTYPRYTLRDGTLVQSNPAIDSTEQLRALLADPAAWRRYVADLGRTDRFASPLLANSNFVDRSVLLRILRRAWAQYRQNDITDTMRGANGLFEGAPDLVPTMQAIVVDFARKARAHGQRPVVLLFEDRGFDRVFRDTLVPTLVANDIPYVLSADIAPATDPGAFRADGHFRPRIDQQIAEAALPLIDPVRP